MYYIFTAINTQVFTKHLQCNFIVWILTLIFLHPCVGQLGPEKGVIHLASAAVLNAVWDLWARAEGKVGLMLLNSFNPHNSCVFGFFVATVEAARWHGESRHIWFMSSVMWSGASTHSCDISGSQTDYLLHWLQVHHWCSYRGGGSRWGYLMIKIASFCTKK